MQTGCVSLCPRLESLHASLIKPYSKCPNAPSPRLSRAHSEVIEVPTSQKQHTKKQLLVCMLFRYSLLQLLVFLTLCSNLLGLLSRSMAESMKPVECYCLPGMAHLMILEIY